MASDLENVSENSGSSSGTSGEGITIVQSEIEKFRSLIKKVKDAFITQKKAISIKIIIFLSLAAGIIALLTGYYIYHILLEKKDLPFYIIQNKLDLIAWYEIGLRVTFISLSVSIVAFCLKMMKKYLSSYEEVKHKITVIDAMPTIVKGTEDKDLFKVSYIKIVDMLIGLSDKEFEKGNEISIVNSVPEFLKDVTKKD
ncbi:MAG TPA: hypothetical protein VN026_17140 [Bacteroidia bacterium]|jgi:hypothetical protein|nr:hypothetical protein [Bacteroidia bacterium]